MPCTFTPPSLINPNPHCIHVHNPPMFSYAEYYIGIVATNHTYLPDAFIHLTEPTLSNAYGTNFTILDNTTCKEAKNPVNSLQHHRPKQRSLEYLPDQKHWSIFPESKHTYTNRHKHLFFVPKDNVLTHKTIVYLQFCSNICPKKGETNSVCMAVGGSNICCHKDFGTPTTNFANTKILTNGTLSTPNVKYLMLDTNNIYLQIDLSKFEYMGILYHMIPDKLKTNTTYNHLLTTTGCITKYVRG